MLANQTGLVWLVTENTRCPSRDSIFTVAFAIDNFLL